MQWRLADAKNRFSELVNLALSNGPQRVSRRNDEVIVISAHDYDTLVGAKPSFKDFLMQKDPNFNSLKLERDRSGMRDIKL